MYALDYPTSLGLEALKLQRQPSILLLIVVSREAHTVTDSLPLWEGGGTELTERLLDKTLSEQHMNDKRKTRV